MKAKSSTTIQNSDRVKLLDANIALSDTARQKIAAILNKVLADQHVIYVKLHNYHWNVTGLQFHSLHEMFEEQYNEVKEMIDETAERIRKVGHRPEGTLKAYLERTRLDEAPSNALEATEMIRDLLETNEAFVRYLRTDIDDVTEEHHDEGTGDMLIAYMRAHETMAWMLRALLEG